MKHRERVVVTGMGVVAPTGVGVARFAASLRAGRSGIGPITAFDPGGLDCRIAAEVPPDAVDVTRWVRPPKAAKTMSRAALFAVAAAGMARTQAGLGEDDHDPERLGVALGIGGMGATDPDLVHVQAEAVIDATRRSDGGRVDGPAITRAYRARTNPVNVLRGLPNLAAAHVAIQNEARGPSASIATACSAGTQAIGAGLRMIQNGEADLVLAGGADATVNPVSVLGFDLLGTLSHRNREPERASRPFDRDRDGFVIGEGSAVVLLERESHARARRANPLVVIAGFGTTCDAWRITDERPDAAGAVGAIRRCLEEAGAGPRDVGYVNAHGTGTRMNDAIETMAMKGAFGTLARKIPLSSTKSMIGHLLAAAGAVELVATIIAIRENFLPPTTNLERADPECDLDYVPNVARMASVDAALSQSFGFGGQNACLLVSRW